MCRGHLRGADTVLDVVIDAVPWQCGRRFMYDRMVDDPRLSYRCAAARAGPPPGARSRAATGWRARYGVPLGAAACNYYRDGRDSVAPHGDRELRDADDTARRALLTLGARPDRSGSAPTAAPAVRRYDLAPGSGDLLVMGGACQRDWEHAVPEGAPARDRGSRSPGAGSADRYAAADSDR